METIRHLASCPNSQSGKDRGNIWTPKISCSSSTQQKSTCDQEETRERWDIQNYRSCLRCPGWNQSHVELSSTWNSGAGAPARASHQMITGRIWSGDLAWVHCSHPLSLLPVHHEMSSLHCSVLPKLWWFTQAQKTKQIWLSPWKRWANEPFFL